MATSADVLESITLKKDIQIRDFVQRNAVRNSAIFFHNDTEPFCEVFVNPVCRSNPEFVSVRVRRCSFYPRFFPGVVCKNLGWTVSVVDDEGMEKFVSYFGYEDFQSLDWVEDFFSERGYELQEFVKRSVLLDDPERFLPGGVLTVRVEMFYECPVGDEAVAMDSLERDVKAFMKKGLIKQQVAEENKQGKDSSSNSEETEKGVVHDDSSPKISTEVESLFGDLSLQENNFSEEIHYWKKESIRMMKETFLELKDVFELYGKLQPNEFWVEPLDSLGSDFCEEFEKDIDLFHGLFTEVGLGPPIKWDFVSATFDPCFYFGEGYSQLMQIIAKNKLLQMHWKNCKEVYRKAAEKALVQISEEDTEAPHHKCRLVEGIRELFLIYVETIEENEPDRLLIRVSRFLKVFVTNVHRILSLRLFWPLCACLQELFHQSQLLGVDVCDFNDERVTERLCDKFSSEIESVTKSEETSSTTDKTDSAGEEALGVRNFPPTSSSTSKDEDRTRPEKDAKDVDEIDNKPTFVSTSEDKHIEVFEEASSKTDLEASNELWYFTVETSDHKRFEIPFQTGSTTLGSLLRSASPVFDRMLETPMAEKSNRFLKIEDFESSTFSRFLSYLESGKVDVDTSLQELSDLYQLAHKYQVEQLVGECAEKIGGLMVLNSDQSAEFSRFFGDDYLMSSVDAARIVPRGLLSFWGLSDGVLDMTPLFSETTYSEVIKGAEGVLEYVKEGVVEEGMLLPDEEYDFYE